MIAITSEAPPPKEIDSLEIEVERNASTTFFQIYSLVPPDTAAALPGTITLENRDGTPAADPVTVTIRARLAGKERILRKATLGFNEDKTKLLRLPLRYACEEFPSICPPNQACIGGQCADVNIDVQSLPDYHSELVGGTQGSGTCFDDRASACLASIHEVDMASLMTGSNCDFRPARTGSGGQAQGGEGSLDASAANGVGNLNLAVHWTKSADASRLVVLDFDAQEGWTFADASKSTVRLSRGICDAIRGGTVARMVYSTACAPKELVQPICLPAPVQSGGCDRFEQEWYKQTSSCAPGFFLSSLASVSSDTWLRRATRDCEARQALPGSGLTSNVLVTCADALAAQSCDQFVDQLLSLNFGRCNFTGSLAEGSLCLDNSQCSSGYCDQSTNDCGLCRTPAKLNEPCGGSAPVCDNGLECSNGKCVKERLLGAACGVDQGFLCSGLHVCIAGQCQIPRAKVGDSCATAYCISVDAELTCDAQRLTCIPQARAAVGQTCDVDSTKCVTGAYCRRSSDGGTTGTCAPALNEGDACDDGIGCGDWLSCIDGKCGVRPLAVCMASSSTLDAGRSEAAGPSSTGAGGAGGSSNFGTGGSGTGGDSLMKDAGAKDASRDGAAAKGCADPGNLYPTAQGKTCADYCTTYFTTCATLAMYANHFASISDCLSQCSSYTDEQLCCRDYHAHTAESGNLATAQLQCGQASGISTCQ